MTVHLVYDDTHKRPATVFLDGPRKPAAAGKLKYAGCLPGSDALDGAVIYAGEIASAVGIQVCELKELAAAQDLLRYHTGLLPYFLHGSV